MTFRDDMDDTQNPEDAAKTKVFTPRAKFALPTLQTPYNQELLVALMPSSEPKPAPQWFFPFRGHQIDQQLHFCPGDECLNDRTGQMPCAAGMNIYKKIKADRPAFKAEREAQQKRHLPAGSVMDPKKYAEFDAQDKLAKRLMYKDINAYLCFDATAGVRTGWKQCYGDFTVRNAAGPDAECTNCPLKSSCAALLSIFWCNFSESEKSTGKKLITAWSYDIDKSGRQRKEVYSIKPGADGNVHKRLVSMKWVKGEKDQFADPQFIVTSEVQIPQFVMKKIVDSLQGRKMSDLILPYITVSNTDLMEEARHAIEGGSFPFGEKGKKEARVTSGSGTPVEEEDEDPYGMPATPPPTTTPAASPSQAAASPQQAPPTTTTTSPSDQPIDPAVLQQLINDPDNRTDRHDPASGQPVPVCKGHHSHTWTKCRPDQPPERLCSIIAVCQAQTSLARIQAYAGTKPAPTPPPPVPPTPPPTPTPVQVAPPTPPPSTPTPAVDMDIDQYCASTGIRKPTCFGDPMTYKPGSGRACKLCEAKHPEVVKYCGREVEAAKQFM